MSCGMYIFLVEKEPELLQKASCI